MIVPKFLRLSSDLTYVQQDQHPGRVIFQRYPWPKQYAHDAHMFSSSSSIGPDGMGLQSNFALMIVNVRICINTIVTAIRFPLAWVQ